MQHVREALRQVIEGADFEPPEKLLGNIKPEEAAQVLPGLPYSIATNVAHTDIWNRQWLSRLEGTHNEKPWPDFPVIPAEQWPETRDRFLSNLNRAYQIACSEPFQHHCRTDESASRALLQIAVHTAYHIGQMKLLKRALSHRRRKSAE